MYCHKYSKKRLTMKQNGYEAIAYPETYTDEGKLHSILTSMRKNDPVSWLEPDNYTPFWAITKHSDISEIELKNDFQKER